MTNPFAETPELSKNQLIAWLSLFSGLTFLSLGLVILVIIINSLRGIFPDQTTLGGIDISLLSKEAAQAKIEESYPNQPKFALVLTSAGQEFTTNSASINFTYQIAESVDQAFADAQAKLTLTKPLLLLKTLFEPQHYRLNNSFDQEAVQKFLTQVASQVDEPGHQPYAKLGSDHNLKTLTVDPGKVGQELDQATLFNQLTAQLQAKQDDSDINLAAEPVATHHELSAQQLEAAEELASLYVNTTLNFTNHLYKDLSLEIKPSQLVGLLAFPPTTPPADNQEKINAEQLEKLIDELAVKVSRESQNAIFEYEKLTTGQYRVNKFQPHQDGLTINRDELKQEITTQLEKIATHEVRAETATTPETLTSELPLIAVKPDVTLEQLNDLGIKELIGFGDSYYAHSIPNRVWNVALTAQKIDLILIPPGTEFSFNKGLGEVSRRTGYRSAYVISGGKTVLGDGGGVCQVSTTLFRAVLNAGLNITKRKAHSYRVSYYELNQKPGIDATVYSGDVDLRFINDTPGYILLKTSADSDNLYMTVEIYGTSDGRTAEILNHKTWDLRPAPPAAYYPTTELPPGKLEQIDWAVSGIKASFDYVVKDQEGNVIRQENYYSNYVPWSAKYLQGV